MLTRWVRVLSRISFHQSMPITTTVAKGIQTIFVLIIFIKKIKNKCCLTVFVNSIISVIYINVIIS